MIIFIKIHVICFGKVGINCGTFKIRLLWMVAEWTVLPSIIYNKPTRCNSGSIVFINNYKYALHVSDALWVHHQEHYKL